MRVSASTGNNDIRVATESDLETVVNTLTLAFGDDPIWRPTLTRPGDSAEVMRSHWRICTLGALRYPWTWILDDGAAVAVWIPPGGTELSAEQEEGLFRLAESRLGADGRAYLVEVFERFSAAHPHSEPHYYLSLLATHPAKRGHGLGMQLVLANLARTDAEGVPAYLESSNPINNQRYERVGFRPVVTFGLPHNGPSVTGMWRPAQPLG